MTHIHFLPQSEQNDFLFILLKTNTNPHAFKNNSCNVTCAKKTHICSAWYRNRDIEHCSTNNKYVSINLIFWHNTE